MMVLIETIYRRTMRHRPLLCSLFFMFGICVYFVYFYFEDDDHHPSIDLNQYDDAITFWSNDFHISPIHDLKHLLTPLGVLFIDKSLSGACRLTGTCAKDLRILSTINGINPNRAIRKQFYQSYQNDSVMKRVDAFVCFHPAAMCELFMPFNRTILVIASTRYELGRFAAHEWNQWNENLRIIASDSRNTVAANNLYDAEYIRYFTGINASVLPSICDYTDTTYHPSKNHPEFVFMPSRGDIRFNQRFLAQLNLSIKKFNSSIIVKPIRDLYQFYSYSDLARHPAIIYLPYQVSTMSIFEQYAMNIPLFFPSLDLLADWHLKYDVVFDRTWDKAFTGHGKNHSTIPPFDRNSQIPDPNNEHDYASIRYWLKYADFYQWPHITYFHSIDDLTFQLTHTNFTSISQKMSDSNHQRRENTLRQWKAILDRISTSSSFISKSKSL